MKDFPRWNERKMRIDGSKGTALFHEREVWWCALGQNIGYEQDGLGEAFTRPVVILSKFNLDSCLIVPLTSRPKVGRYYAPVGDVGGRPATAILSQLRFVDRRRLQLKIGMLPRPVFEVLVLEIADTCLLSSL